MAVEVTTYQELNSWRRCRQRWLWQYGDGEDPEPVAGQLRGIAGSEVLNEYYRNGRDMSVALRKVLSQRQIPDSNLLRETLLRYAVWARQNDRFEVVATDQWFSLELPAGVLTLPVDMVVVMPDGKPYLVQHRLNKRTYLGHIDINAEIQTAILAADSAVEQLTGSKPAGLIFNVLRLSYRTAPQNEAAAVRVTVSRAGNEALIKSELNAQMEEVARAREGEFSIYRNLNPSCGWDCPFVARCQQLDNRRKE